MYNGDYFAPLQPADEDRHGNHLVHDAGVGLPAEPGNVAAGGGGQTVVTIKGTPVVANGVMCVSIPDHVWAVDAQQTRAVACHLAVESGWHIGNRVAVLGRTVYVETPDCNLVALDSRDGREKWRTEICDLEQFYYAYLARSSSATTSSSA